MIRKLNLLSYNKRDLIQEKHGWVKNMIMIVMKNL